MTETVVRETQIADALRATAELREQGWGEATVEVTRGGTVKVTVKAEAAKVARPAFTSGLRK